MLRIQSYNEGWLLIDRLLIRIRDDQLKVLLAIILKMLIPAKH